MVTLVLLTLAVLLTPFARNKAAQAVMALSSRRKITA